MKINLEEPFRSLWLSGYLRYSKEDGRGRIDLINSKDDRTTISYARYLKSVELGYILPREYEVDHKNVDHTNDNLDNLQVLTKQEHRKKTAKDFGGRDYAAFTCPECETVFVRETYKVKKNQSNVFCSRQCNGKSSNNDNRFIAVPIDAELVEKIKALGDEGYSGYKIAKVLDISANTARTYLKQFCTKVSEPSQNH